MKEYRLTFATDNFGAISQILVDMGVSFRVEPMEAAASGAIQARAGEAPAKARSPAKKPAKTAQKKAKRDEAPIAGAARQLERWSRGERDTGASGAERSEAAAERPAAAASEQEEPDESDS
jgi:hypothetical protein